MFSGDTIVAISSAVGPAARMILRASGPDAVRTASEIWGDPVPDANVEFGFLGEVPGAGVDPGVVTTGDDGTAEAFVRLGTTSGTQMVLARVVGAASPELSARFRVIARNVRGGDGGDGRGPGNGNGNGKGSGKDDEDD